MKADISRITFDPVNHRTDVISQQGRVAVDADWNEQRAIDTHLRTTALIDVIGARGAPIDHAAFAISAAGPVLTLAAGRYYLGGHLLECEAPVALDQQPDLPDGPFVRALDGTWIAAGDAVPAGVYIAYVSSWSQHLTAVEDPTIREVALGGPDTTTRLRTLWQVRLIGAGAPGADVSCAVDPPGWKAITDPSTGTLAVFADPEGEPAADCLIPEASPYRGLDNQLYRIEIHEAGAPGAATYVWSSDNGAVTATWESTDVDVITVKNPGRDGSTGFTPGCWVELTDDRHEQLSSPGTLVRVDRVDGDRLVLLPATATGSIVHGDFSGRPRVRRWDGVGTVPADGAVVPFELGVRGTFGVAPTMTYRTGDYWTVPARTATADVEWPQSGGNPVPLTPHGPQRRFGKLAVLAFDGASWTVQTDCRPLFAPLVDQLELHYVGGDGQEVLPDVNNAATLVPAAARLVVGVATGGRPIVAAPVRFTVAAGNGTVDAASVATVDSDADGLVSVAWSLDSATALQTVTAELLDHAGQPRGLPVSFSATLSRAAGVGYDPAASPSLAGTTNVQEAIDRLAAAGGGGGCETLVLSPDGGWRDALANLGANADRPDVTVCLRPGRYETDTTVTISGVRHLRITGAGNGTQLVGAGIECVLEIAGCDSAVVRDLAVAVESYPDEHVPQQLGAITFAGCRVVEITDVDLRCPDAPRPRAACVTVRAGDGDPAEGGDAIAVTERCTIRACRMSVGHAQTGALVINARFSDVSDCEFFTPQGVRGFTFERLLADRSVRQRMISTLVGKTFADRSAVTASSSGGRNTGIDVGEWQVRFDSGVPAREWARLVAAEPPTPADTLSADGVRAYMSRITTAVTGAAEETPLPPPIVGSTPVLSEVPDETLAPALITDRVVRRGELDATTLERIGRLESATGRRLLDVSARVARRAGERITLAEQVPAEQPVLLLREGESVDMLSNATLAARMGALPTFDRQLTAVRASLGESATVLLDGPTAAATRRALLVSSDFEVAPLAAIRQRDRDVALSTDLGLVRFDSIVAQDRWELAVAEMPPADRSAASMTKHLRAVARRMLLEPAFSARVAPGLLDRLKARDPAVAALAVRVGGRTAEAVTATRNRIRGAAEGIHVGISDRKGTPKRSVGSVRVSGNDISLTVPVDLKLVPRSVFVGNVDRVSVVDNRSTVIGGRALEGVHIEGDLGRHLVVRDNELENVNCGVLVRDTGEHSHNVLWVVADNVALGASSAVVAPSWTRVTGNMS